VETLEEIGERLCHRQLEIGVHVGGEFLLAAAQHLHAVLVDVQRPFVAHVVETSLEFVDRLLTQQRDIAREVLLPFTRLLLQFGEPVTLGRQVR